MDVTRPPEILAPAGDAEAMRAAVRAGADAVYFGLRGFNARARAENFDVAALDRTLAELHRQGVRGYVTLNTLVFDDELPALERAVTACAEAGADAVIVQDLGVVRLVAALAPSLPIHASTQMTCTDAAAVALAGALGARRVILARELSLDDIAAIADGLRGRGGGPELEVFVHGALCIAYSGQCLTSEAIGGRSANRGACAQACRLPYELLVDGAVRDLGDRAYLLSPSDLETSALVPRLIELGVSSLKIEGRLKGPDYVAATTRLYRAAVDAALDGTGAGKSAAAELASRRQAALLSFSRGSGPGFLGGVDHQRLVEGRACDHRGIQAGVVTRVVVRGGRSLLAVRLCSDLARGDGVLVEGGWAGEGELGGRVWGMQQPAAERGAPRELERAGAGDEVLLWLGPERPLDERAAKLAGRRLWKNSDPAAERAVLHAPAAPHKRLPLDVRVSGGVGEPPRFLARAADGTEAVVDGDSLIGAGGRLDDEGPLREALRGKLGRLGDTPFALRDLEVDLPPGTLLPPSSLNRARRALVEALLAARPSGRHPVTGVTSGELLARAAPPPASAAPRGGLFVLCRTHPQAEAAAGAGADGLYLDFLALAGTGEAVRSLRQRHPSLHLALAPPRIRKPGEDKIDRFLAGLSPDALLVRSLGALGDAGSDGIPRVGDFSLNVTNRLSAAEVLGRGLIAFTPSFDLDAAQLERLLDGPLAAFAELVVHHPMPLFHMEHCVIAALLSDGADYKSCGRPCERHALALRDRAGMAHPVEADVGCRNTVFHAAAQSAAALVAGARERGVRRFRIELVREQPEDVARLLATYRRLLDGEISARELFRAVRAPGGYGVVQGSLRVLPSDR